MDPARILGLGLFTVVTNLVLMLVKFSAGIAGNSQALIADGIESASDVVVSLVTWSGLFWSLRPPDATHPYGHGRMESLAGIFAGFALIFATIAIAATSIGEIRNPGPPPEWFTLPVLVGVIAAKELLFRKIRILGSTADSRALEGDAWHQRSDAITSAAAAAGISIALIGGEKWAVADDIAALLACLVILFNGLRITARSLHENLDGRVGRELDERFRQTALAVPGVCNIEKCRVRKSGLNYFAELHVEVDPSITVEAGHEIGHAVKDSLLDAEPGLIDAVIHLEPWHPPAA